MVNSVHDDSENAPRTALDDVDEPLSSRGSRRCRRIRNKCSRTWARPLPPTSWSNGCGMGPHRPTMIAGGLPMSPSGLQPVTTLTCLRRSRHSFRSGGPLAGRVVESSVVVTAAAVSPLID